MIEIFCQKRGNALHPASLEYSEALKAYKDNQILKCVVSGTRKPRSVLQNKWLHAMFRHVASNTEDMDWDTPEKVKRNIKMKMKFFKDEVTVAGNRVYFELRSFAFDQMEHNEANIRYEDAKNICAKFLGVEPQVLEANAQREDV